MIQHRRTNGLGGGTEGYPERGEGGRDGGGDVTVHVHTVRHRTEQRGAGAFWGRVGRETMGRGG